MVFDWVSQYHAFYVDAMTTDSTGEDS